MSCTGSFPRKWSIRNRRSSGKIAVSRSVQLPGRARDRCRTASPRRAAPAPRRGPPARAPRRRRGTSRAASRGRRPGSSLPRSALAQPIVERPLLRVPADVAHARQKLESTFSSSVLLRWRAIASVACRSSSSLDSGPAADADDRTREQALLGEVVERGQRAAPREIAGDAEDDECVRVALMTRAATCATERSMSTPSSRSSTAIRSFAEWTSFVASSVSMALSGKNPYAVVPNASRR